MAIVDLSKKSMDELTENLEKIVKQIITPTAKLQIDENGTYKVRDYGYVKVNVPQNRTPVYSDINLYYNTITDKTGRHVVVSVQVGDITKDIILEDGEIIDHVINDLLYKKVTIAQNGTYDVRDVAEVNVMVDGKLTLDEFNKEEIKKYTFDNLIESSDITILGLEQIDNIYFLKVRVGKAEKSYPLSDYDIIMLYMSLSGKLFSVNIDLTGTDLVINHQLQINSLSTSESILVDQNSTIVSFQDLKQLYESKGYTLLLDHECEIKEEVKEEVIYECKHLDSSEIDKQVVLLNTNFIGDSTAMATPLSATRVYRNDVNSIYFGYYGQIYVKVRLQGESDWNYLPNETGTFVFRNVKIDKTNRENINGMDSSLSPNYKWVFYITVEEVLKNKFLYETLVGAKKLTRLVNPDWTSSDIDWKNSYIQLTASSYNVPYTSYIGHNNLSYKVYIDYKDTQLIKKLKENVSKFICKGITVNNITRGHSDKERMVYITVDEIFTIEDLYRFIEA